jgi:hypothetical protein
VSGRTFAHALVELLVPNFDLQETLLTTVAIGRAAANLPPQLPLRRQLLALLATANNDVNAFLKRIEQWYDEEMAKMSGWYRRWARVTLGITGLVIAVTLNLDTLQVAHSLYVKTPVQQAVLTTAQAGTLCQNVIDVATRTQCANDELSALAADGLPIGWPDSALGSVSGAILKVVGWLITAFAVSFGAPFWFEALSKLGSLRTGNRT